ncbi:MAG: alpha-N-acetylglucosaminidase [Ignavibacteriales bacterium]|nr:alpha-N-acetylglucosaminidase [Ignavibacteriales bacterium]
MENTDTNTVNLEKVLISNNVDAGNLIKRLLPHHYDKFVVYVNEKSEKEFFGIRSDNGKIILEGSNQITIASALNWYLKYYNNSHIGWNGDRINLFKNLQDVNAEVIFESQFQYRFFLNYCTYSYSMPWWNWERWEREIDFMAMNGINLVLALVGQEAVWQNVMQKLGCSEKDIFDFLPGPAYLAWGWLNNLDGWGGPTTQNWIDDQKELQLKILERMRSLQMKPVLQAFTGRVPKCLTDVFPDANIIKLPGWYKYDGVYFLDPLDPLFKKISKLFFEAQSSLYGNDHYFAGDIFHEIDSSDKTKDYMSLVYRNIEESLLESDSDAKWILQSWTIRDDSIAILDTQHTIILDMFCESEPKWKKTEQFHGQPWVWSIINNFGGRTGLGGPIKKIIEGLQTAKVEAAEDRLIGIGVVPEGIENNMPVYELLLEMNWRAKIDDVENWILKYAERRYGLISSNIEKAWSLLLDTVYTGPKGYAPVESVICAVPSFNIKKASSNGTTELYYSNSKLLEAVEFLLADSGKLCDVNTYKYDIIDVTRQFGANLASQLYGVLIKKYFDKDAEGFKTYSEIFVQLCIDLDELLSCSKYFSLGNWLESAKQKAKDENDLKMLEWNARRQITLWSSPEITEFHDYANKQWGGLIKDYYLPRWKEFFKTCLENLSGEKEFDEKIFTQKMMAFAVEWSERNDSYKIESGKDAINTAKGFVDSYKEYVEEI